MCSLNESLSSICCWNWKMKLKGWSNLTTCINQLLVMSEPFMHGFELKAINTFQTLFQIKMMLFDHLSLYLMCHWKNKKKKSTTREKKQKKKNINQLFTRCCSKKRKKKKPIYYNRDFTHKVLPSIFFYIITNIALKRMILMLCKTLYILDTSIA